MKKILIILTTILLSINITGCIFLNDKVNTRYTSHIEDVIKHINENEQINLTRKDIDFIVYNIKYTEPTKEKYLTYEVTYYNTKEKKYTTKTFLLIGNNKPTVKEFDSKIYKYEDKDKVKVYSKKNINSDNDNVELWILIIGVVLFIVHYFCTLRKDIDTEKTSRNTITNNEVPTNQDIDSGTKPTRFILIIEKNKKKDNMSQDIRINKPIFKKHVKHIIAYTNIILSFIFTLIFIRKYSTSSFFQFTSDLNKQNSDYLDYAVSSLVIIFVIALIALCFILALSLKKWYIGVFLILTFFLMLCSSDLRIKICLSFFFFLNINYLILKSLPVIYNLLKRENSKYLDPEKLTLLWTIIVFILGLLFNIK